MLHFSIYIMEENKGIRDTKDKTGYQATLFSNRLTKRFKHLSRRARRSGIGAYRLYDRDIPEVPLALDVYNIVPEGGSGIKTFAKLYLYARPYYKAPDEEALWLDAMIDVVTRVLSIDKGAVITAIRQRQRGKSQYNREGVSSPIAGIVCEGDMRYRVVLQGYLDTGLFLDTRPLRAIVRDMAGGKSVLNLFCYTGGFSVAAAKGGATIVESVDSSATYIKWCEDNMVLNGFTGGHYIYTRARVEDYFITARSKYDLIILDPPTFSNTKDSTITTGTLDINRDYPRLIGQCVDMLKAGGVLIFSTNSRKLRLKEELLPTGYIARDITVRTIGEDYRGHFSHRVWLITLKEER